MRIHTLPWAAVFALLICCMGNPAAGQVNIEKLRETPEEQGFSTDMDLLFYTRSGNVDITQLGLHLRTDYLHERSTSFIVVRGLYGWKDGDPFSNEGLVHGRHVYRRLGWLHPEVFAQIDYDKARLLDSRAVVGGGLRFNVVRSKNLEFSWGTAYMLERELYDVPPGSLHSPDATAHRWSNYVSFRLSVSEHAGATWITYVQPRFDAFDDVRMLSEGGVESKLTDLLSLTVTLRLRYDSAPPDGVEKYDTFFSTGLKIEI